MAIPNFCTGPGGGRGGQEIRKAVAERVPRGRCLPPIPPVPNPRRGEIVKKENEKRNAGQNGRRASHIVVLSSKPDGDDARKPISKWKRGYIGFKRKIKSSSFMPLLLLMTVCGIGLHVVGIACASLGYFTWTVACEGVVMVAGENSRANGIQTYSIGWVMYEGEGPSVSSESAILASKAVAAGNNGTITDSEGQGGVAGSSIPAQDWLASVDGTAAALGILTSVGHLMGVVFHGIVLYFVVRLFRSHFRSDRPLFRHTSKASGLLFIWLVGFSLGGFYLAVQGKFRQSIVSTLTQEGFRCQENGDNVTGDFAYIATGFGCAASASTFLLTWRFGQAADHALADRFQRKASVSRMSP